MSIARLVASMKAAGCSAEQVGAAALAYSDGGQRSSAAIRQARHRARKKGGADSADSVTRDVTRDVTVTRNGDAKSNASDPEPRACVLYGEDSLIKELPTVDRKIEPDRQPEVEAPKPVIVSDLRKAKKAADSRTLDFVGEGWNALCASFPRMARIGVIPDGGKRETGILARTKELLKDFDQPDAETGWKVFFGKIRASPFLRGEAPPSGHRDRAFKPTLDSLTAPQMFLKIMEDHYVEEIQPRRSGSLFDQRRQWG